MSDDWSLFGAKEKYAKLAAEISAQPRCEICGFMVRDGLRFCSGMSECLKKGIGIMDGPGKTTEAKPTEVNDPVNPAHYKQGPVELIEIFEEMGIAEDFCHGNMIKYLERAGVKNPATELEDFRKARWYAKRLVKIVGERVLAKRSK